MATIQEILGKLDIEFVEGGGHQHSRPGWLQIKDCPFCGSTNYHLGYNLRSGYLNCWRCGSHPVVATLIRLGLPDSKASEFYQGLELSGPPEIKPRMGLKEPTGRGPLGKCHELYLLRRGFDPAELARIWSIEGIRHHSRLSWRIYIPIISRDQRVSWTTRAIGEKVPQRYLSASAQEEAHNHKELVYGLDYCQGSVVVVEGPTDAWAIGPGAGALFGTAFSSSQVRKLIKIPRRFICFDSAREAQARAWVLVDQLASFPGTTSNLVIDAKDPGSASPKEIRAIRRAAKL